MMKNRKNKTFLFLFFFKWYRNSLQTKCLFDKLRKILTPDDLCTLLMISDNISRNVFHAAVLNQTKETLKLLFEEAKNLLTKKKLQKLLTAKALGFKTVLHLAISRGVLDIIRLVLNKDKQILTSKQQIGTLLHAIVDGKYFSLAINVGKFLQLHLNSLVTFSILEESKRFLTTKKLTQLLMITDEYGYTLLHKAVMENNFETVRILLQETEKLLRDKDLRKFVMAKTSSGETVFDLTIDYEDRRIRPLLIAFLQENQINVDFLEIEFGPFRFFHVFDKSEH